MEPSMANMLRILMGKVDNIQEQMGNLTREVYSKKIYKNARNIKHCNDNEKCFLWLIRGLNMAKERISELEDMRIELPKLKSKKKRELKKKIENQQNIQELCTCTKV